MNFKRKKNGFKQDSVQLVAEVLLVQGIMAYCFYKSVIAFCLLTPIGFYYYQHKSKELHKKKQLEISMQFKEMITAISTSLRAGYSIENACRESLGEMQLLYGTKSVIYMELQQIIRNLRNNQAIEGLFQELAFRLQIDEVREFAQILIVAKKYGGDLSKIIQNTSDAIGDKIQVNQEIDTVISGKKTEQAVMNFMPLAIILYMQFTTPGFFESLYHNVLGVCVMSSCVAVYIVAYRMSCRILEIHL